MSLSLKNWKNNTRWKEKNNPFESNLQKSFHSVDTDSKDFEASVMFGLKEYSITVVPSFLSEAKSVVDFYVSSKKKVTVMMIIL